jgi:poly(A) polymerase
MDTITVYEAFADRGYALSLRGFSALDRYWGLPPLPFVWALTDAGISNLACMFETLRFPGVDLADGSVDNGEQCWYFRCLDDEEPAAFPGEEDRPSYKLLSFFQDAATRRYLDPLGLYPILRKLRDGGDDTFSVAWWADSDPRSGHYRALMEGAIIISRYAAGCGKMPGQNSEARIVREIAAALRDFASDPAPQAEAQRILLTSLLVSPRPDLGLELLKAAGFVSEFWPELALLDDVDHSKEFHPEGNVWKHTLETFQYRKKPDLLLSLALLLHDVGKPLAESSGSRRFDGHAEIGAKAARKFLKRLDFDSGTAGDVYYLVRNHMLPAALPRLPLSRTEEIIASPLFPTLLELYRCDESSSFKGLEGFYESSAAYKAYLRNRRNPYRSADGKKNAPKLR